MLMKLPLSVVMVDANLQKRNLSKNDCLIPYSFAKHKWVSNLMQRHQEAISTGSATHRLGFLATSHNYEHLLLNRLG
jgi:hypothetical protein